MKGEKQSNQRCVGKLVIVWAMEAESHRVLRIAHSGTEGDSFHPQAFLLH